ncbi:hypothetical protein Tco_0559006 [Tanacetum coccineum]
MIKDADYQQCVELSLKMNLWQGNQGLCSYYGIREPDTRRLPSHFLEVQGKGKENIIDEQVANTLLDLNTPKKKSTADQYILQRRTPKTAEPTGSSSQPKDEGITMTNSETESDEVVTPVNKEKDASYRELTEINIRKFQPQPSHVVHAGPNLEPIDLEVTDASTQQNPDQMDEEFTTTAYLSVQENLKLPTGDQEEEPEKTNDESEVQSMVTVPIHQDTSSVPPMTTAVIDLITPQLDSPTIHAPLPTSTATTTAITTTTTLPPPPLQP